MAIPRPSKHEEKISAYLQKFGKDHKYETLHDELGNVLIRKPASKGYEKSQGVCLQAHMDMVCEKNGDKKFDFLKDPIQPILDGEWLTADGTTLGADDGIGVAAAMAIILNLKKNPEVSISFRGFRPDGRIIGRIYQVGLPSIIMQSIGSLMTFAMNRILGGFSSTAVAVFGVYFKLQSFIFMPVFGLNNGMVPIVAYNYGARNRIRMIRTMRYATIFAVAIMSVGTAIFEIFPRQLFALFNASEHMLGMGEPALRIIALHFPIAAVCIIMGSVFQSLGNGIYSMINSIMRQIVVLLPAAYLLSLTGNVNNVWWSFPIAELMSLIVTVFFMIKINKDIISQVPEGIA